MNLDICIGKDRLPEDPPTQTEPGLTEGRCRSPAPSNLSDEGYDDAEYAVEIWDVLSNVLQAQEDDFIEQDEAAPMGVLFDAPATPIVKEYGTTMSPTLSFKRRSTFPSLVSAHSPSPSLSPLKSPLRPLFPTRTVVTGPKNECQPHVLPPHLHGLFPSQGASLAGPSARTETARESPSRRFFASPDQIDALGTPRSWLHGQVISTLGDTFCHTSRSKPMHKRYETLPTDLFDLWDSFTKGHSASRTSLTFHFKQATTPLDCRAWLVPVLLEHHWYLLTFDWVDCFIRISDSLATNQIPHPRLAEFGNSLVKLISNDLNLAEQELVLIPELVSGFYYGLNKV